MEKVYNHSFLRATTLFNHASARLVTALMLDILPIRSVVDFGCCEGGWLHAWRENGVEEIQGLDGSYIDLDTLVIDKNCFQRADLTAPVELGRRFDLVQSLEVAEHLPKDSAAQFVRSLTRYGDWILFSASPPGQGGEHHVNEQPYAYWRDLFLAEGYILFDCIRPQIAHLNLAHWYKYNTFLYASRQVADRLPIGIRQTRIGDTEPVPDISPWIYRLRKQIIRMLPDTLEERLAQWRVNTYLNRKSEPLSLWRRLPKARSQLYTSLSGYRQVLGDMITGCWQTPEEDLSLWEQAIAQQVGGDDESQHAVATPMARVGIYLAIKALIQPRQKVALSPYTIADVINMVVCAGGEPLFVDIESDTCNISYEQLRLALENEENVGAVLVTHFYGLACDMPRISELCREYEVPLIEDCAQAFGVHKSGRMVGSLSDVGIFSFGLYKVVNTFYGGMVVTRHAEVAEKVRKMQQGWPWGSRMTYLTLLIKGMITDTLTHPLVFKLFTFHLFRYGYFHDVAALNRHMSFDVDPQLLTLLPDSYQTRYTPAQARLGLDQLVTVQANTRWRIQSADLYYKALQDIPELILPPMLTDGSHGYTYYAIQYHDRKALVRFAMENGCDIAESHHKNCASLRCFSPYARDCPNAATTADNLIYLPTYPDYNEIEIERTIAVVRAFFVQRKS